MATHIMRNTSGHNYNGYDPGMERHIAVEADEIIVVSADKAAELTFKFPQDWADLGEGPDALSNDEAPNVVRAEEVRQIRPRVTKPAGPSKTKGAAKSTKAEECATCH